jgi:hypothetical protein
VDGPASQIGSTPAEAQGALRSINPATSRPDQGTFGPVPGQLIGVTLILNGDECTQCVFAVRLPPETPAAVGWRRRPSR